MFKRAYLSLTRRWSKVTILFVILFVVTTLILTTLSIKNATEEAEIFAKKSIGSEVTLSADMDKAREEIEKNKSTEESNDEVKDKIQNFERPQIYIEDVKSIADSKYLTGYMYTMTTYANVVVGDIELVESEVDKMGEIKLDSNNASNSSEFKSSKKPGEEQNFEFKFDPKEVMKDFASGDITVEAVNNLNYLDEYINGTLSITDGKAFDEAKENEAIISYDLATLNSIKVGDKITLLKVEDKTKIEITIVGIYDTAESETTSGRNFIMNSSNKIYTNIPTAEKFLSEEDYNKGNCVVSSCVYYLQDPNNYDAFIAEAGKKVNLEEKSLKLSIDQTAYDKMVGAISEVGNFSSIIFWVVIGASILIITLIINSQVKERKYEIGVLLSLGEKKSKITMQIMLELLLTMTFAIILATFIGMAVSGVIGDKLLANQIKITNEQQEVNGGRGTRPGESNVKQIDELDVSVGIKEIGMLFGISYLLVIVSMSIPMMQIVKYDPKTILSRRE